MDFSAFLKWLVALGPRLPAILAALQDLYDAIADVSGDEAFPRAELSPEDSAIVAEIEAALPSYYSETRGLIGGGKLLQLFKWLNDSGLLTVLLSQLAK